MIKGPDQLTRQLSGHELNAKSQRVHTLSLTLSLSRSLPQFYVLFVLCDALTRQHKQHRRKERERERDDILPGLDVWDCMECHQKTSRADATAKPRQQ